MLLKKLKNIIKNPEDFIENIGNLIEKNENH
jgi:hypothetical protein